VQLANIVSLGTSTPLSHTC